MGRPSVNQKGHGIGIPSESASGHDGCGALTLPLFLLPGPVVGSGHWSTDQHAQTFALTDLTEISQVTVRVIMRMGGN